MPFKEKIAWISVVTTILVWGTYFTVVLIGVLHGQPIGREHMIGFLGATIIQVGLVVVASIVTAVTAPKDASAGSDERDKAIARGSSATAYPVLLVGVVVVAASIHFGANKIDMTSGIMAAIVIAEIVHYAAQIVGYRSGQHG
jgi:hypothetical protein